jgi:Relaxase/Mobilisation nuclease domain/Large polyvalent protein-associated domain 7
VSAIVKLIEQSDTSNVHLKTLQKYIVKPEANQASGLDVWYFNAIDDKSAHAEMLALNEANNRAKNTFKHLLVSFSPDVFPTREQAREASKLVLTEMGLDKCVSMVGMHYDQDHAHLHIAVVTIDPNSFKAVHAEWAVEAMHRAAAKINFIQGWKPQNNQLYSVINIGEEVVAVRNSNKGRTLKAAEVSTFQGQRPAADIAAEVVKLALKDISINSWDTFNKRMAQNGIEYQRKGSGSIFMIEQGDKQVAVKASVVNRNATMKLLVSKFGPFISNTHPVLKRKAEPVKGMNDAVQQSWQNFRKLKVTLTEEKLALKNSQKVQYQKLLEVQKTDRNNIYSQSWKGKGAELNKARMILAARQAQQKAKLRQIQLAEKLMFLKNFHNEHGSTTRFDDYLKFTDANLLTQHKEQQRQAKMDSKIFPEAIGVEQNPEFIKVSGIEAYEFQQDRASNRFVLKFTNQDGRVDFIDEGKRIKVIHTDRESIRAFLQLSSQKWQKFELTGSLEFKYMCAEEALKLHVDIKITNPEIQTMMTHIHKLENTKKNGESTPVLKLRRWDKPILVKARPLKDISVMKISNPINLQQQAINAFLTYAEDVGTKPKNDYLRDLEIAIRLQATGYSDDEIAYAINHISPNVISKAAHAKYTNHLVNLINTPAIKHEWKDVVDKKSQDWIEISKIPTQTTSLFKPKF